MKRIRDEEAADRPVGPADEVAAALRSAAARGYVSWNQALMDRLADEVEIRHTPAAEKLDGWRSRQATIEYLEAEILAFPRAFRNFHFEASVRADDSRTIVGEIREGGIVKLPKPRHVALGFQMEIGLLDQHIVRFAGSPLPETAREDMIAWLKAVDAAGGFHPPPPSRP